ncbi:MAG: PAS domain S-box protein, partial [Candidatus Dadabacteria bacterium]
MLIKKAVHTLEQLIQAEKDKTSQLLYKTALFLRRVTGSDYAAIGLVKENIWEYCPKNCFYIFPKFKLYRENTTWEGEFLKLPFLVKAGVETNGTHPELLEEMRQKGVGFLLVYPVVSKNNKTLGWILIANHSPYKRWSKVYHSLISEAGKVLGNVLDKEEEKTEETKRETVQSKQYRVTGREGLVFKDSTSKEEVVCYEKKFLVDLERIASYGAMVIFHTDKSFVVEEIIGDTDALLGISKEEIVGSSNIWREILPREKVKELMEVLRKKKSGDKEIEYEISVVNKKTGRNKYFILRGSPYSGSKGKIIGWEGILVDITEKKRSELWLERQSKRLSAMIKVAEEGAKGYTPEEVALAGVKALMEACSVSGGFLAVRGEKGVEILASKGLSLEQLSVIEKNLSKKEELDKFKGEKEVVFSANLKEKGIFLDLLNSLKGSEIILAPLSSDHSLAGVFGLIASEKKNFSERDKEVIAAATKQLWVGIQRAKHFAIQKKKVDAVEVLYKLSRRLSTVLSPSEVAERAFPIIQQVLPCKRMWLGVLNEQGTRIIGQGGVGPGIRGYIKGIQIELDLRHDALDEAISTQEFKIVRDFTNLECSGLQRILKRLEVKTLLILPLVSLGQVIGVLIAEPKIDQEQLIKDKISILSAMATEIASVILARRFELKLSEADKMRMAGLLASGVAHNFNNLLQAIMGQASLISMQLADDSPLKNSADIIVEAASRGANLIRQLLGFSMHTPAETAVFEPVKLLKEAQQFYQSVVGSHITLLFELEGEELKVRGDPSQIQQVVTNLIINARDAVQEKDEPVIV